MGWRSEGVFMLEVVGTMGERNSKMGVNTMAEDETRCGDAIFRASNLIR